MRMVDIRPIDLSFFHPFQDYTKEEVEMFRHPLMNEATRHYLGKEGALKEEVRRFKVRIDLVLSHDFRRYGCGSLLGCLKEKVLNLLPTSRVSVTRKVLLFLLNNMEELGLVEAIINENDWIRRFIKCQVLKMKNGKK